MYMCRLFARAQGSGTGFSTYGNKIAPTEEHAPTFSLGIALNRIASGLFSALCLQFPDQPIESERYFHDLIVIYYTRIIFRRMRNGLIAYVFCKPLR